MSTSGRSSTRTRGPGKHFREAHTVRAGGAKAKAKAKGVAKASPDRRRRAVADPYTEAHHGDGGTGSPCGKAFKATEDEIEEDEELKPGSPSKKMKVRFLNNEIDMVESDTPEAGTVQSEEEEVEYEAEVDTDQETLEPTQFFGYNPNDAGFGQPVGSQTTEKESEKEKGKEKVAEAESAEGRSGGLRYTDSEDEAVLRSLGRLAEPSTSEEPSVPAAARKAPVPTAGGGITMTEIDERLDDKLDKKFDKITANLEKMLMNTTASLVDILDQKMSFHTKISDKKSEDMKKEITQMLDDSSKEMNLKIEKLSERLAAMEKDKDKGKSSVPPRRSVSENQGPTTRNLPTDNFGSDFDPWARFNENKKAPTDAAAAASVASAAPPTRRPVTESDFVPRCVHVKGWCRWQDPDKSLTRDEAYEFGLKIVEMLSDDSGVHDLVRGVQEPRMQNNMITINVEPGETNAKRVRDALARRLDDEPLLIHGKAVFAMVEPSPAKRQRNATIAKANKVLEDLVGGSAHVRLDVRAGVAYFAPDPNTDRKLRAVGNYSSVKQTWVWRREALSSAWPELDYEALEATTRQLLQE